MFASIETVSFAQFMIATLGTSTLPSFHYRAGTTVCTAYTARLFVAVWIGSRIAMFSDGTQRDKMDTKTKIVNIASILIGVLIAFLAGWYVHLLGLHYKLKTHSIHRLTWRLTEKEIRKTAGATSQEGEDATEALEEANDSPLIRSFSPQRYRDASVDEPSNNDLERGKAPEIGTSKSTGRSEV